MILCLETSSTVCSVALFEKGELVSLREDFSAHSHSSRLVPMVEEALEEGKISFDALEAVAISAGPGSYTGLRIGVSTAKGFCDACGIPLIAVPTLQAMASGFVQQQQLTDGLICPMFDARRMEVYYWLGDVAGNTVEQVQSHVLDGGSFKERLQENEIYFVGSGAKKTSSVLNDAHAHYAPDFLPSARWMGKMAEQKLNRGETEDLIYYEPFYLKDSESHLKPVTKKS